MEPNEQPNEYNPTPEEIANACEKIRATWSESERKLRGRYRPRKPRNTEDAETVIRLARDTREALQGYVYRE